MTSDAMSVVLCLSHGFVDPMVAIVRLIGKGRLKTVAVVVEELSGEVLVIGLRIVDRLVGVITPIGLIVGASVGWVAHRSILSRRQRILSIAVGRTRTVLVGERSARSVERVVRGRRGARLHPRVVAVAVGITVASIVTVLSAVLSLLPGIH